MNRRQVITGGGVVALTATGTAYAAWQRLGSMAGYDAAVAAMRTQWPAQRGMAELVRYAMLAPSGHNTQPWRFRAGAGRVDILADISRRTPVVDPDDHHLFVGLGCAAENLALAAGARGQPGDIRFDPAGGTVSVMLGGGPPADPTLFQAIARRQSTRADYDGKAVGTADLRELAAAATVEGVDLVLMTGHQRLDRVRDLVVAGNDAQMANPAFLRELKSWLRFNPR